MVSAETGTPDGELSRVRIKSAKLADVLSVQARELTSAGLDPAPLRAAADAARRLASTGPEPEPDSPPDDESNEEINERFHECADE